MAKLKKARSQQAEEIIEKIEPVADIEITDDWLKENIEIKQYVSFISKEQKEKTFDSISRLDDIIQMLKDRDIMNGEHICIKDKNEYEQLLAIHTKLKGFYYKDKLYVSFEGREDIMMELLLNKHKELLINDYKPLMNMIDKTKWYNSYILQLLYSSDVKKLLFEFCIKTNAKQNNITLKKDFEYIQNNKIEEDNLILCIQNAMQERIDDKGNKYTWKALYLKEGVNV